MMDFEQEIKLQFLDESTQLLDETEQVFLELDKNASDPEILNKIFRLAHNLKGTSRAVGFGEIAEFTHELENLILKLKMGEIGITEEIINVLLESNDHLRILIHGLKENLDAKFDSSHLIGKIRSLLLDPDVKSLREVERKIKSGEIVFPEATNLKFSVGKQDIPSSSEEEDQINQIKKEEMQKFEVHLAEELNLKLEEKLEEEFAKSKDSPTPPSPTPESEVQASPPSEIPLKKESSAPPAPSSPPAHAPPPANAGQSASKGEDESIRVSLSKVEKLNNFVGELVILQAVLDQQRDDKQFQMMAKTLSQLRKISKEIQELSLGLRMIPIKTTLQKIQRIVRDTSKALNKKVKLVLVGEETEVDKTVLEHLADPLVHIVRNAIDHGLETPEQRIETGKKDEGTVKIWAYHEGNSLVIEIDDDGKGINPQIIRKKAIEKGILSPKATLSDEEIIQFIFHPGFSTKDEISEISGRGVGMDVVKNNIEHLSGDVKVKTELGKGTNFRMMLPLSLAIIEAMIIRVGEERYVFPMSQVHETLSPKPEYIHHIQGIGTCLNLRGEVIPLFNLGKFLNRPIKEKSISEMTVIIIQSKITPFAILVEDIIRQQQVVIKKLGDEINNRKGIMGISILGDGRPAFIIDINELFSDLLKKNINKISQRMDSHA